MHVLSAEAYAFWQENGYVVIHNAVPQENLDAVVDVLWAFLGMDRNDPETWYPPERRRNSMVELYQHPALWNNRQHPRVYGAFVDIWQTEKLWVSLDRVSMNPPDRPDWGYKGFTHWDIDTSLRPLPYSVQGVLYLTDTAADQGGFHCVPGFHRIFEEWVKTQPADRNPFRPDLTGYESKPIPGKAGDLLIWHSLLPHGNGQNLSTRPRLAQYITMSPAREANEEARQYRIKAWNERLPPLGKAFPGDPRGWEQQYGATAELTELGKKLLGLERW
jgi:ectoine hydroxylase-related dioxygenase (phytanoyl-CoA dioxygenase family)